MKEDKKKQSGSVKKKKNMNTLYYPCYLCGKLCEEKNTTSYKQLSYGKDYIIIVCENCATLLQLIEQQSQEGVFNEARIARRAQILFLHNMRAELEDKMNYVIDCLEDIEKQEAMEENY